MYAGVDLVQSPRLRPTDACAMQSQPAPDMPPAAEPSREAETKRAIRELLDVLPKDVLDELNNGAIDLKDPAFLDGLTDHVSRLSLANPRNGQRILGKIIKLKKLITRSLRESDPEVPVSITVTRTGERVGRNDACPCGSGKKYKQCCLRKP
jgi:SEC-C motif